MINITVEQLEKSIRGSLKATLHDHGTITYQTFSSTIKRIMGAIKTEIHNSKQNEKTVGTRRRPLCFSWHKKYGYVPVIAFEESTIIWDDGQITRELPPSEAFEIAAYNEFDLTKPAKKEQLNESTN